MSKVDGKVVLVTGGGAGLGKTTCELLAKAGANIFVSDINMIAAEETAQSIVDSGGTAVAVQQDVASEDDWERTVGLILKQYGKLDVLVNNAGIGAKTRECSKTSLDEWDLVLGVNLKGTFLGMRSAINAMGNNKTSGSIINISSIAALTGSGAFSYSAAKGAVRSMTRTAAIEVRQQGYDIRVNAIYPGETDTPGASQAYKDLGLSGEAMQSSMDWIPLGRMAQSIEIARGVLFLASDDSSYMTGSDLVIDGGCTAGQMLRHTTSQN